MKLKLRNIKSKDKEKTTGKKCKYLGSMLDTKEDIKRRKQLAMVSFKTYQHILISDIDLQTRMRIFRAYVTSVFMYSSELWTINKERENEINMFQRKLLRMILKIHWPYKIRNDTVYERTGEIEWSKKIEEIRMKWLGQMLRLPENTPAKLALKESLRPVKRPRGRQKDTWNTIINRQLKEIGLSLGDPIIEEIAQYMKQWRFLTNGGGAVPTNGGNA